MLMKQAESVDSKGDIVPGDAQWRYLLICEKFWQKRMENRQKNLPQANRNELRYHCCLSQLYFIGH
jgi:hypothetical protein